MAVETADDRSLLLADFGVTASFVRDKRYGTEANVTGIFDNEYFAVDAGGSVPVAMQQPTFLCRTADIASVAQNDILTISGLTYRIRNIQPDGQGMTMLMLEEQ